MKFVEMLRGARIEMKVDQKTMAKRIGCSQQYYSDLETGRRLPSVRITNTICEALKCGLRNRLGWHLAAAHAHGWEV